MGDLLATVSILADFFAGGVALFAPCCIVFLAPSYLSVAVKNRRWRLLPLTFVFAAGLALVLVPITLGMSLVASTIANYHRPLYYAGGALMLVLAAFTLSGKMISMPSFLRAPDTRRGDTGSFFLLGMFSGIASSCCAPVLAGVMTLSALSGSALGGVTLGLAYTFGMVFPLFVMGLLWDRYNLGERRWLQAKTVRLRLAGRVLVTNSVNLVVAVGFAVMAGFVIYLASTAQMTGGPPFMASIGRALASGFGRVDTWLEPVPEPVLGLGLAALAALFVVPAYRARSRRTPPTDPTEPGDDQVDAPPASCHGNAPAGHDEHHTYSA